MPVVVRWSEEGIGCRQVLYRWLSVGEVLNKCWFQGRRGEGAGSGERSTGLVLGGERCRDWCR